MIKSQKVELRDEYNNGKTDYVQSAALGIWVRAGAADEKRRVFRSITLYRAYDVQGHRKKGLRRRLLRM